MGIEIVPKTTREVVHQVARVTDNRGSYDEVKAVLLKAVKETPLTYGHQLFEIRGILEGKVGWGDCGSGREGVPGCAAGMWHP